MAEENVPRFKASNLSSMIPTISTPQMGNRSGVWTGGKPGAGRELTAAEAQFIRDRYERGNTMTASQLQALGTPAINAEAESRRREIAHDMDGPVRERALARIRADALAPKAAAPAAVPAAPAASGVSPEVEAALGAAREAVRSSVSPAAKTAKPVSSSALSSLATGLVASDGTDAETPDPGGDFNSWVSDWINSDLTREEIA